MPVRTRFNYASRFVLLTSLAGAAVGLAQGAAASTATPGLGAPPLTAEPDGSTEVSDLHVAIEQLGLWTWSPARNTAALDGLLGDIVAAASAGSIDGATSGAPMEPWDEALLFPTLSEASLRVAGRDRAVFASTARNLARIAPTEADRVHAVRLELRSWEAVVVGAGAGSLSSATESTTEARARILAVLESGEHRASSSQVTTSQFEERLEGRLDLLAVGRVAPRFLARDTAGNEVRSPLLRGQILVIRFWEQGSPVSMAAHEEDALVLRKFWDAPVALFGATSSGERKEHLDLLEERSFGGTQLFDGPISTALADELALAGHGLLHGSGLSSAIGITNAWSRPAPGSLVVVDERGVIRGRDLHGDDLESLISLLVSERRASIRAVGVAPAVTGSPR